MGYRDDRDAWRQKAEQLERDLERAQRELAEAKGGGQHGDGSPRPIRSKDRRPGVGVFILVVIAAGVLAAGLLATGMTFDVVAGVSLPIVLFAGIALVLSRTMEVVPPNRALVVLGRGHQHSDGSMKGYRVVRGGRVVPVPFVEMTSPLDLSLMRVETRLERAFSRGGLALTVDLTAWIGVEPSVEGIHTAAERLMGLSGEQVGSIAIQTIEGVAREVIAGMTPEEILGDRLALRQRLLESVEDGMHRLGLCLEAVFVRSVDDAEGYVSNLGREAIARALRDAQIRDSEAQR